MGNITHGIGSNIAIANCGLPPEVTRDPPLEKLVGHRRSLNTLNRQKDT